MRAKTATVIVLALGAAVVVGGQATARTDACKPGPLVVNGQPAVAYCGPASATIKAGGKTVARITSGRCYRRAQYFQIDVGIDQPAPLDRAAAARLKRPDYFHLALGNTPETVAFARQTKTRLAYPNAPRDGTYTIIRGLTLVRDRTAFTLSAQRPSVTLRRHRTAGTFTAVLSGKDPRTGKFTAKAFTGSFSCS